MWLILGLYVEHSFVYQIPLWHQRASHRADGVILWDYHAICVQVRVLFFNLIVDGDGQTVVRVA